MNVEQRNYAEEMVANELVERGCASFRVAIEMLEKRDPELARRLFVAHRMGTEILHELRG